MHANSSLKVHKSKLILNPSRHGIFAPVVMNAGVCLFNCKSIVVSSNLPFSCLSTNAPSNDSICCTKISLLEIHRLFPALDLKQCPPLSQTCHSYTGGPKIRQNGGLV